MGSPRAQSFTLTVVLITIFIALIHPIQWTITYPVGAHRPAKCQKKTSCVSTGRPARSTSALARWRVVLPSCLDRVTSWHLFRLARTSAHTFCFCGFCVFYGRIPSFFNIIGLLHIYRMLCLLRGRKGEAAAMQWPALMSTPVVHAVAKKERGRNPALQTKTQWIVSFVIYLPLSSGHKFQLHPINLRKKRGKLSVLTTQNPRRIVP